MRVGGCFRCKAMLEEIHEQGVEPTSLAVREVFVDLLPRELGDERPRRIALNEEGLPFPVDEIPMLGVAPNRKARSCVSGLHAPSGTTLTTACGGARDDLITMQVSPVGVWPD